MEHPIKSSTVASLARSWSFAFTGINISKCWKRGQEDLGRMNDEKSV